MGRFCLAALANFCLTLKVFWEGYGRTRSHTIISPNYCAVFEHRQRYAPESEGVWKSSQRRAVRGDVEASRS